MPDMRGNQLMKCLLIWWFSMPYSVRHKSCIKPFYTGLYFYYWCWLIWLWAADGLQLYHERHRRRHFPWHDNQSSGENKSDIILCSYFENISCSAFSGRNTLISDDNVSHSEVANIISPVSVSASGASLFNFVYINQSARLKYAPIKA